MALENFNVNGFWDLKFNGFGKFESNGLLRFKNLTTLKVSNFNGSSKFKWTKMRWTWLTERTKFSKKFKFNSFSLRNFNDYLQCIEDFVVITMII